MSRSLLVVVVLAQFAQCVVIPRNVNLDTTPFAENILLKRALSSVSVVTAPFTFGCTDAQITAISQAVTDAKTLARTASSSLGVTGVETSVAYQMWLGATNGNAATRVAVKTGNYEALISELAAPTNRLAEFTDTSLDETGLTYLCPAADSSSCAGTVAGFAHQSNSDLRGNIIGLCPIFFDQLVSQQTMATAWKRGNFQPSQSFALLHEVQHQAIIVGQSRRCVDQRDPSGGGCYSPVCCFSLPDAQKITNAQNMAFFATDAFANPDNLKPEDQATGCVIQKREAVLIAAANYRGLSRRDIGDEILAVINKQKNSTSTITTARPSNPHVESSAAVRKLTSPSKHVQARQVKSQSLSSPSTKLSSSAAKTSSSVPKSSSGAIKATLSSTLSRVAPSTKLSSSAAKTSSSAPKSSSGAIKATLSSTLSRVAPSSSIGDRSLTSTSAPQKSTSRAGPSSSPTILVSSAPKSPTTKVLSSTSSRVRTSELSSTPRSAPSTSTSKPITATSARPITTTRPLVGALTSAPSGQVLSTSISTSTSTTTSNGVPIPIVIVGPVVVPVPAPPLPPGGGNPGGGNGEQGAKTTPASQPNTTPTTTRSTTTTSSNTSSRSLSSSSTTASCSRATTQVPSASNVPTDADGLSTSQIADIKKALAAAKPVASSSTTSSIQPSSTTIAVPPASSTLVVTNAPNESKTVILTNAPNESQTVTIISNAAPTQPPPGSGPARFSCSCVNGSTKTMPSTLCNAAGGATGTDPNKDGTACNGLTTKIVSSDCVAMLGTGFTADCNQTG